MEPSTLKAFVRIHEDCVQTRVMFNNRIKTQPDNTRYIETKTPDKTKLTQEKYKEEYKKYRKGIKFVKKGVADENGMFGFKTTVESINKHLSGIEDAIKLAIEEEARQSRRDDQEHEKMYNWLMSQRGIGTVIAGGFMAYVNDIKNWSNVSKLQTYSGLGQMDLCTSCKKEHLRPEFRNKRIQSHFKRYKELIATPNSKHGKTSKLKGKTDKELIEDIESHFCKCECPTIKRDVAQRSLTGGLSNYNTQFNALMFQIGDSMVKNKNPDYAPLYYQFKAEYEARPDLAAEIASKKKVVDGEEKVSGRGHVHAMARRKMIKIWMQNTWEYWRKLEGYSAPGPYAIDILKHADKINPLDDKIRST